jgi:FkbM family methyltransferase
MIQAIRNDVPLLREQYGNSPRYEKTHVVTPHLDFVVPDIASFLNQLQDIFVYSAYELPPGVKEPVIYDCGANVGVSALYFSLAHPGARILAFEADPDIVPLLRRNLDANGAADVQIIDKSVWTEEGTIRFYSEGADAGSCFGKGESIAVPSLRLADMLAREARVDLLKLDIEGAEQHVLPDLAGQLHRVDRLFMEYHSLSGSPQNLGDVVRLLESSGFRLFINGMGTRARPFVDTRLDRPMDCQIEIWAYRPPGDENRGCKG